MLTERTTTLFVSIFYFQKCQTRDYTISKGLIARATSPFKRIQAGRPWGGPYEPLATSH